MSKLKPPCIRGISRFNKSGCPEKCWDGEEGCTAWVERTFPNPDRTKPPIIIKACMDVVMFDYQLESLRLLEGIQIATETFRNGMCEMADGKVRPKPDPGIMHLMCLIQEQQNSKLIK